MRAYLAIKYHADNANRARIEQLCAVLEKAGLETVCIIRDLERWGQVALPPRALMRHSCEAIAACDLVVVELTEKGVGIGIEAGFAHALHIPIVTVAQEGADISETLRGISQLVCHYRDPRDLLFVFVRVCARLRAA